MILRIYNHDFHYEAENLCRVFYPYEKISVVKSSAGESDLEVVTLLIKPKKKPPLSLSSKPPTVFLKALKTLTSPWWKKTTALIAKE